jgi:pimeloyl-ACP methyl ester carboxylesterase
MLLGGCAASPAIPPARLAYYDSDQALTPRWYDFRDGGRAMYFEWTAPNAAPKFDIFVIPGSGCTSMRYFFPAYFAGLDLPAHFLALQKRGISPDGWGDGQDCPTAFHATDYPSRTFADQLEFFAARRTPGRKTLIVGISEGAETAVQLAQTLPEVSGLVLIGHAGVAPLTLYRLLLKKQHLPPTLLDKLAQDSVADGDLLDGRSARYWRETLALRTDDTLLALPMPVWIALGGSDPFMPAEAADILRGKIQAAGKRNIAITLYPGADHSLCDSSLCSLRKFFVTLAGRLRNY